MSIMKFKASRIQLRVVGVHDRRRLANALALGFAFLPGLSTKPQVLTFALALALVHGLGHVGVILNHVAFHLSLSHEARMTSVRAVASKVLGAATVVALTSSFIRIHYVAKS